MSIVSSYETYRDRVFRAMDLYFPVNRTLDILAGNDPETNPYDAALLARQRKLDAATPDPIIDKVSELQGALLGDDDETEEEVDDEFSDGA